MNTTGLVITVTDELLAELEDLASAATPGPWKAVDYGSYDGKMQQFYVDTSFKKADIFESCGDIEPNNNNSDRGAADMQFVACANPATITALTAELRRLRAENAELAKDAGRYRWLRIASAGNESAEPHGLCVELWDTGSGHEISGADLDTSIDTAMATQ